MDASSTVIKAGKIAGYKCLPLPLMELTKENYYGQTEKDWSAIYT